jgi:hypothetical protein
MSGFLLYSLLLLFLVPVNIVAYRKVVTGRRLGTITNSVVVSQLRLTAQFKALYWIVFYTLHAGLVIWAVEIGAWISMLLLLTYMSFTPALHVALRKRGWVITSVPVARPGSVPPPLPPQS